MEYQKHYQLFRKFFGINVKFHCNEQNLSISDLASISGLSKQFIELVVNGKAHIDFDDFLRIACGLKIQPFMLLENTYVLTIFYALLVVLKFNRLCYLKIPMLMIKMIKSKVYPFLI